MLMANLWQEVGLCNGAAGTVSHLLYHEGHAPPNLPIAVLVNFDNICWASPLPRSPQMCTHTTTLSRKEFWRKAPLTTAITSSNQICNHYPQKPGTNLRQSCDWHWECWIGCRLHFCCSLTLTKATRWSLSTHATSATAAHLKWKVSSRKD